MSDNASPRPWHTANFINGIEDANNGKVAANLRDEDADFIVKAVNLHEWLVEHNKLNAESACELFEARDRLRDFVSRLADLSWNLLANYEARYGYDRNSMDFVENNRALISEARAAIRKEGRLQ